MTQDHAKPDEHRALERVGYRRGESSSLVGRVIDERWRLDSCIGRGAFGQVYHARDVHTGEREVAIKIFTEAFLNSGYLQELGLMFDEQHPNIVEVLSFGYTAGRKHIVYEYVPGGSLRDYLVRVRHVEPAVALELTAEIARALVFAHGRNVVHRDLKPENILLERADLPCTVKLCDFGLSARFSQEHKLQSSFGSPAYMAPEQFEGEYDWRVDFYAVGVILYEMLFGRRPFTGDAPSICYAHKYHEITLPAHGPGAINELLRRLLAKDPAARFQSAEELLASAEACLQEVGPQLSEAQLQVPARDQLTLKQRWMASLPQRPTAYGVTAEGEIALFAARRLICVSPQGQFMELHRPDEPITRFLEGGRPGQIGWLGAESVYVLEADGALQAWTPEPEAGSPSARLILAPDGAHALAITPRHLDLYGIDGQARWRAEIETYGVQPPACFGAEGQLIWVAAEAPRTQLLGIDTEGQKICRVATPGHDVDLWAGPEGGLVLGVRGKRELYRISREGFIEDRAALAENLLSLHGMGPDRLAVMSTGHVEIFDPRTMQTRALLELPSPQDLTLLSRDGLYQVSDRGSEVRLYYYELSH